MSYIKTISQCQKCSSYTINFSWVHCFQISTKKFFRFNNFNFYYDISSCLNTKKTVYEKCDNCNKKTEHEEQAFIYKPAKNIIIIIKRGENYENRAFIDFQEVLSLNSVYDNRAVNYKLKGIISKKIKEKYYNYYLLNNNIIWTCSLDGQISTISLDEIKKNDLIISLFYEIEDEKTVSNDIELNQIYYSIIECQNKKNLFQENDLNIRRTKSEFNVNNNIYIFQNNFTQINKQNQNNYNFMNNNGNNMNNFGNFNNYNNMNNFQMSKNKSNFMSKKHSNIKLDLNKSYKSSDKNCQFNVDISEYKLLKANPIDTGNNINIGSNANNANIQQSNYLFSNNNINNNFEKKNSRSLSSSFFENNDNFFDDENYEPYKIKINNYNKFVNITEEKDFDYIKGKDFQNQNENIGFL